MRTVPAVLLAALALAVPARADTVIGGTRAPTPLAAYDGLIAYSAFAGGRYKLALLDDRTQTTTFPPVKSRAIPFDVDLGPGPDGRPVAVYSRCRKEAERFRAETSKGCDVYRFDIGNAREQAITAINTTTSSELLPSIHGARIAFVRANEPRSPRTVRRIAIVTRRLDRAEQERRLPGGPPDGAPTNLDLGADRLAFSWLWDADNYSIRVDPLAGGQRVLIRAPNVQSSGGAYDKPLWAALTADGVVYARQHSNGDATWGELVIQPTDPAAPAVTHDVRADVATVAFDGTSIVYSRGATEIVRDDEDPVPDCERRDCAPPPAVP